MESQILPFVYIGDFSTADGYDENWKTKYSILKNSHLVMDKYVSSEFYPGNNFNIHLKYEKKELDWLSEFNSGQVGAIEKIIEPGSMIEKYHINDIVSEESMLYIDVFFNYILDKFGVKNKDGLSSMTIPLHDHLGSVEYTTINLLEIIDLYKKEKRNQRINQINE